MKPEDARTLTWVVSIVLATGSAGMIFGAWPAVLTFALLLFASVARK